jgi:dTDP-4-amino-4,6-dideoxygalactose transaminase
VLSVNTLIAASAATGGVITTNDEKLYNEMLLLRGQGVDKDRPSYELLPIEVST